LAAERIRPAWVRRPRPSSAPSEVCAAVAVRGARAFTVLWYGGRSRDSGAVVPRGDAVPGVM
jgi:hypothetical protein